MRSNQITTTTGKIPPKKQPATAYTTANDVLSRRSEGTRLGGRVACLLCDGYGLFLLVYWAS